MGTEGVRQESDGMGRGERWWVGRGGEGGGGW